MAEVGEPMLTSSRSSTPPSVSWFEFLLDNNLLEAHLSKENPEPSATDLIIQFLANAAIPQSRDLNGIPPMIAGLGEPKVEMIDLIHEVRDSGTPTKKTIALKLLALKVTAFLIWNLNIIQKNLPLPMQNTLFSDFLKITMGEDKPQELKYHLTLELSSVNPEVIFALMMYHRWCIRAVLLESFPMKPPKINYIQVPGQQDPTWIPPNVLESLMKTLHEGLEDSIVMLEKLLILDIDLIMPTLATFDVPTELKSEIHHNWNGGIHIEQMDWKCQTCYDLGCIYFFKENYNRAGEMFFRANDLLQQKKKTKFVQIDKADLKGYCQASSDILKRKSGSAKELLQSSLVHQLQASIGNNYEGVISLLIEDNRLREIALAYRKSVEHQILRESSANPKLKKLHVEVMICNALREILEGGPVCSPFLRTLLKNGDKDHSTLIKAIQSAFLHANRQQKIYLKNFIRYMCFCGSEELGAFIMSKLPADIILPADLEEMKLAQTMKNAEPPPSFPKRDYAGNKALQMGELERELFISYNPKTIKHLLSQLHASSNRRPLWKLNVKWELPNPINNFVHTMPSGFIQDYIYILIAKARELTRLKSFSEARLLLDTVDKEISDQSIKLSKAVRWEAILVDLLQAQTNPPIPDNYSTEICKKCKTCITALQSEKDVLPRSEIIEHCAAYLLNFPDWEYLSTTDVNRSTRLDFCAILSKVCLETRANNGSRRAAKELWETVLPMFTCTNQQKRSGSGIINIIQRDAPHAIFSRIALNNLLDKIQNMTALSVIISCLAKLHNILKDDSNNNIYLEYGNPWPSVVNNASVFSIKTVCETLTNVLKHALELYPRHPPYLKTMADLNYVLGHHAKCLRFYLEAAIVCSDHFCQPVPRSVFDDQVYRRMIRCCSQLGCHSQSAVLCQFLEETDYMTAFKALQEKNCADSMDAYYNCFWDMTILEFLITLHTKRGEVDKKQIVLKVVGQLELNSNNNEEINREAANLRKSKFLRAMVEQYI